MATHTGRSASEVADAYDALLDDLVAEAAALRRLVAGLPPDDWSRPTSAPGWAVRDQIVHLAFFDRAATLAAADPDRFRAEEVDLLAQGEDFPDAVGAAHADLAPMELLSWWDRTHAELVRTLRRTDPRARLPWYGPEMSAMSAATARLMETWAHGVDVSDALGIAPEESPRLRHVAHLGNATQAWSFTQHGLQPPAVPVRVELDGPGDLHWEAGPVDAEDVVRGRLLDFCLVVTQRRHPSEVALQLRGHTAGTWMSVAQAFAGRPTRRPAPTPATTAPATTALATTALATTAPATTAPATAPATLAPREDLATAPATSAPQGDPTPPQDAIHRVNVGDLLTRSARRAPSAVALVDGARRFSYADLDQWVNRIAHGLLARGYRRGDRLALVAGNCAEFLAVYFACAKTGVVCVPVNLGWRPAEVGYVLRHSGARGVVVEEALLAGLVASLTDAPDLGHVVVITGPASGSATVPTPVPDLVSATAPGDRTVETLAELAADQPTTVPDIDLADRDAITYLYTSGTTSAPKGVIGSHLAVYLETLSMALECRFDADDRFVAMLPMFHTAQLNVHCTPAIAVGATIHVLRGFDAGTLLALIEQERITQIFGLPMMYRAMLDHPDFPNHDLRSLRRAAYAMAPMPEADLRAAIDRFGCDFYLLFGQTEMSPATTIFRPEHQLSHAGAVGTPIVNVEVAIMDDDGQLLPPGEVGEIVYRGPHAMTGYLDDPMATEAVFAHGWFHSGDAGSFDDDGILWFRDRLKDVIKTGGENVASLEVEQALMAALPDAAEVAVVGLPHARWSEAITAFVVPRPGQDVDEAAVRAALRSRLDGYKLPKRVVAIDAIPRTSTGKVRKNILRERYRDLYEQEP